MISTNFTVQVNEQAEFSLDSNQIDGLDIRPLEGRKFHVLFDQTSYEAEVLRDSFNDRQYAIQIGSNVYQIDIGTELDELIRSMGYKLSSESAGNEVNAPMPGIILEVKAEPGASVTKGDTLLILEAMKMENAILSPKDGVIKSVLAVQGDTVDKNKLLIELE